jgi:hypothetical protein
VSNPLSSGKTIAEAALIAATGAACVIPDAWAIAGTAYTMQSDPGAMYDAAEAWLDAARKLGEAVDEAIAVNNSLAADWEGADQAAFSERLADYTRELMVAQVFACTVGIALMIAAFEVFVAILVLAAIAVGLVAFAVAILAAIASVVGNLGASEALELDAALYAAEAEIGLNTLSSAMKVTDLSLAAGVGTFLVADVGIQAGLGNTGALTDLVQATVDSIGTVAAGLVAKAAQTGLGKVGGTAIGRTVINEVATALGITTTVVGVSPWDPLTDPIDPSR